MISLKPNQQELYKKNLVRDLSKRSITGTFIYLLVWFLIALNIFYKAPDNVTWLLTNSGIILVASIFRMAMVIAARSKKCSTDSGFLLLSIGAAISGITWGILFAISSFDPEQSNHLTIILLATVGLCAGGALTLSASRLVMLVYLSTMLFPVLFTQLLLESKSFELVSVVSVFFFGLIFASKQISVEYQKSLTQNIILNELSSIDQLTGIKNRGCFDKHLEKELSRSRKNRTPLSIIMMDIDHFKEVNDTHGHDIGDKCLITIANHLQSRLHTDNDIVARFGGEEFVIILPNTTQEQCQKVAERIRLSIQGLKELSDLDLAITVSLGSYTFNQFNTEITSEMIMKYADTALYASKAAGRNCYTSYSSNMT